MRKDPWLNFKVIVFQRFLPTTIDEEREVVKVLIQLITYIVTVTSVYVVGQFDPWLSFYFPLFYNHNIMHYIALYIMNEMM